MCDEIEFGDDPTALYRLYDADGALLYVGIAYNTKARMEQHAREQGWWAEVSRRTVRLYASRNEAAEAEEAAIESERPRHNVARSTASARRRPQPGEWVLIPP